MGEDDKGKGNPGYVPMPLCSEYRAHIETKIDNMESAIKSTIKITVSIVGFIVAVIQLMIHFWG